MNHKLWVTETYDVEATRAGPGALAQGIGDT